MLPFELGARLTLASQALGRPLAALADELPTAGEVLEIYRQNKERLSRLHVQTVHVDERGVHASYEARDANGKCVLFWEADDNNALRKRMKVEHDGKRLVVTLHRTKPWHRIEPMEFFVDGEKYQYRVPVQADRTDKELKAWRFPTEPLTPESLPTAYREIRIFSRSPNATPVVRIWDGGGHNFAYISQTYLEEWGPLMGPPLIDAARVNYGQQHPIDVFFSFPAENYRVLGKETIDGRLLALVRLESTAVEVDQAEPQLPESQPAEAPLDAASLPDCRLWVDLDRGALPMRIEVTPTGQTMVTQRVVQLPNGAFYPAKTVSETLQFDPATPELTAEQWAEVRAGKRKPALVVKDRSTWDCSLVELKTDLDDDVFVFSFPDRQTIWDEDTGKMVGASEVKPLVKVGQPAPPLTIGRWVDGTERTLAGLRGQIVVLEFGSVQTAAPKELHERFADKPVVFIAIYTAQQDAAAGAAKIEKFQKENHFQFIAAIDAGWAHANSATRCAYGVATCGLTVIVDREGKISYVDPQLRGPRCDEEDPKIMAAWKKVLNQYWQTRFKAVGETWPLPKGLSEIEEFTTCQRVNQRYIAQQIETALAAKH